MTRQEALAIISRMRRPSALEPAKRVRVPIIGPLDSGVERIARTAIERAAGRAAELEVFVDSEGGSVEAARRIADDIRQIGMPATAMAGRQVSSAATLPYVAAKHRVARPDSRFFFHRSHLDVSGVRLTATTAPMLRELAAYLDGLDTEAIGRVIAAAPQLSGSIIHAIRTGRGITIRTPLALAVGLVHEAPGVRFDQVVRARMFRKAPVDALRRLGLAE